MAYEKVNTTKYKDYFHKKAVMIPNDQAIDGFEKHCKHSGWVDVCKGWYVNEDE